MPFVIGEDESFSYESDIHIGDDGNLALATARQTCRVALSSVDPARDRFAVVMSSSELDRTSLLFELKSHIHTDQPYLDLDVVNSDELAVRHMMRAFDVADPNQLSAQCLMLASSAGERLILLYVPITLIIVVKGDQRIWEMSPYVGSSIRLESHTLDS
jgi:hypothetical protein